MLSRSAFRHSSLERVPLRPCRHHASDISCFSPTALWILSSHVGCPPTSTMSSFSPSSFACDPLCARASLDRWLKQLLRTSITTNSLPSQQYVCRDTESFLALKCIRYSQMQPSQDDMEARLFHYSPSREKLIPTGLKGSVQISPRPTQTPRHRTVAPPVFDLQEPPLDGILFFESRKTAPSLA